MIGLGDIVGKIGSALNNPRVNSTLKRIGDVGNSFGSNTAFGANPQPASNPSGFSDVRPMTPPPQTGVIGDIFRNFANRRMAGKTATNFGQGPGAGVGSPDVAVGLGAVR